MTEPLDTRVPGDARWWLAHDGCGTLVWDGRSGTVLAANATALRLLGRDASWAPGGESIRDLFEIADGPPAAELATRLGAGQPRERRIARQGQDDLRLLLITWEVPGPAHAWATLCVDMEAPSRPDAAFAAHPRILQAQKQEALGRLAGGIAHDFSNLLTVVLGHCDAARQLLPRDSPALEELQGIQEAAQQATNLSRQLLTFSRRQVVQPEPLQLDDVVARLTPLFRRLLGARVSLEVVWLTGLPRVLADPGQMEQVLTNLVVNARDAIADVGKVRIATSLAGASAFTDDTGVAAQPGRTYLCLSIRDDGVGMPEEVRQRAFEPFFTTKADDRGTGLGLPTVHNIVTQAGGGVALESTPGHGCDVRVYLPTIPASAAAPVAPVEARTFPGGHETVLLVEDREAVRRVAHRFLSRRGYRVIEAESAEQALEVAEAHAGEIDLLLSDVILGGMDGYALAIALTARQPGLRVVLMSGYPSEMLTRAGNGGPIFPFVNKPIDFPTLAQLLRDQLERRSR
ncbi:Blue-light-activated protein [Luteitalea pratensis]|uniref:histidine kinase n=1 Tax=Luteitalea pratensis TaxID=1855912 RepID=A0A143PH59_LUTPR|nr:ATP-binding protein [Luteitalea pratensis]AMY07897.1 Blue-light-activated protein [Luteitalea pratensis]